MAPLTNVLVGDINRLTTSRLCGNRNTLHIDPMTTAKDEATTLPKQEGKKRGPTTPHSATNAVDEPLSAIQARKASRLIQSPAQLAIFPAGSPKRLHLPSTARHKPARPYPIHGHAAVSNGTSLFHHHHLLSRQSDRTRRPEKLISASRSVVVCSFVRNCPAHWPINQPVGATRARVVPSRRHPLTHRNPKIRVCRRTGGR
ncbi:uncharacterized protein J3D65DRAFT_420692 [Phyllosticta citribraziliensis]|uniref:Uncharacterized protein n=1 Tax=Phyllosticta citribraziliensis TaxID=989973 RepID=A0ABR1LLC7_9PEZI